MNFHFFAAEQGYFIKGSHLSAAHQSKTQGSGQSTGNKSGSPTSLGYSHIYIGCVSKDKNSLFWSAFKAFQNSHSRLCLPTSLKDNSDFFPSGLRSYSGDEAFQRLPVKPDFHMERGGEKLAFNFTMPQLCICETGALRGRWRSHTLTTCILDSNFLLWSHHTAEVWIQENTLNHTVLVVRGELKEVWPPEWFCFS